ncbi:MAG: MEDS domain-containing protein [Candidatus Bathyarchaeota archaeon]|nr:MAG: MEDS domain-containing protein [Candidatus Bathyarchaeota archaeon]
MPNFMKDFLRRMRKQPSFRVEAGPVLSMRDGEVAVATYTSAADKMKVFSAFIREGIEGGDQVEYLYPDEESGTVRVKLEEHGIDVEKHEKNDTLLMMSITEWYMPDGKFDKDRAVKNGLDLRAEAKRKGYKRARELIDVGDFSFLNGQWQKYLEYWDDPKWGAPPGVGILYGPFITELTVFNVEGMSEAQVGDILKAFGGGTYPHTKFIDFLEHAEAFSERINVTREKLLGRKFLLEFDPASNYERAVEDFAKEAMANVEPVIIFTSSTSAVRTCLAQEHAVKFFLMSVSTSTPELISENEILLPANNTALILDSLSKFLEAYTEENVFLVFDSLSELVGSMGLEKTYSFLRYLLDMVFSTRVTALFLLNTSAHEPQVVSCLRGLFPNQLKYRGNELKTVKGSL